MYFNVTVFSEGFTSFRDYQVLRNLLGFIFYLTFIVTKKRKITKKGKKINFQRCGV